MGRAAAAAVLVGLAVGLTAFALRTDEGRAAAGRAEGQAQRQQLILVTTLNRIYRRKSHSRVEGKAYPCHFLASASAAGMPPPHILGWGQVGWRNGYKPLLLAAALRTFPPDAWVTFADAGDSFFMRPPADYIAAAESLLTPEEQRSVVLFSAEMGCPDDWPGKAADHRCPNTGAWIGRASAAAHLFGLIEQSIKDLPPNVAGMIRRDQLYMYDVWKKLRLSRFVKLDTESAVFWSMFEPKGWDHRGCPLRNGVAMGRCRRSQRATSPWVHCTAEWLNTTKPLEPPPHGAERVRHVTRKSTGKSPVLLHFNGPAKHCIADALRVMPLNRILARANAKVMLHHHPNGTETAVEESPLSAVCPGFGGNGTVT